MASKKRTSSRKQPFPPDYNPHETTTVQVPIALVPLLGGLLSVWQQQSQWETREDWLQGYQASLLLQMQLGTPTIQIGNQTYQTRLIPVAQPDS